MHCMKLIYLALMFAFIQSAHAQDYCKQIKKEVSEDKTVYDYASPFDPVDPPAIRVTRSYSTNGEFSYDNFIAIFQIPCGLDSVNIKNDDGSQTEKEEYKIVIEFEDKSKITDDTLKVMHDYTEDRSQALRIVYYPLTNNTLRDFTTKKITRFSLAGHETTVPSDIASAFMQYVICIKAVK